MHPMDKILQICSKTKSYYGAPSLLHQFHYLYLKQNLSKNNIT